MSTRTPRKPRGAVPPRTEFRLAVPAAGAFRSLILEDAAKLGRPDVDPRQIEAYMRIERGALDQLSRTEFLNEVIVAIHYLDRAVPPAPLGREQPSTLDVLLEPDQAS